MSNRQLEAALRTFRKPDPDDEHVERMVDFVVSHLEAEKAAGRWPVQPSQRAEGDEGPSSASEN